MPKKSAESKKLKKTLLYDVVKAKAKDGILIMYSKDLGKITGLTPPYVRRLLRELEEEAKMIVTKKVIGPGHHITEITLR